VDLASHVEDTYRGRKTKRMKRC